MVHCNSYGIAGDVRKNAVKMLCRRWIIKKPYGFETKKKKLLHLRTTQN